MSSKTVKKNAITFEQPKMRYADISSKKEHIEMKKKDPSYRHMFAKKPFFRKSARMRYAYGAIHDEKTKELKKQYQAKGQQEMQKLLKNAREAYCEQQYYKRANKIGSKLVKPSTNKNEVFRKEFTNGLNGKLFKGVVERQLTWKPVDENGNPGKLKAIESISDAVDRQLKPTKKNLETVFWTALKVLGTTMSKGGKFTMFNNKGLQIPGFKSSKREFSNEMGPCKNHPDSDECTAMKEQMTSIGHGLLVLTPFIQKLTKIDRKCKKEEYGGKDWCLLKKLLDSGKKGENLREVLKKEVLKDMVEDDENYEKLNEEQKNEKRKQNEEVLNGLFKQILDEDQLRLIKYLIEHMIT